MANSSDDGASDATEDDPQVPEHASAIPPEADPVPGPSTAPPVAPAPAPAPATTPTVVDRGNNPHYELRHILRGHSMSLSSVKFSPDGNLLASTGTHPSFHVCHNLFQCYRHFTAADKVVKIWNPSTGELVRNLSGHTQGLSDVAWSSDSVYLASASDDTTIRIWDVDSVI